MKNTMLRLANVVSIALLCIANFNSGWAEPASEKIKDFIDDVSDELKKGVDELEGDLIAIQDYLDHYHWKGLIEDEASSGPVTLSHLQLNGHSRAVVVKPGQRIEGIVLCNLDREKCSSLSFYRVVLGIKGQGPQTTVGNELGILGGETL